MAAGELPLPDAGYWMSGDDGNDSDGGGGYHMTMQVCLDLQEEEEGSGMAFPAEQPRARLVFTSQSSLSSDYVQPPSRAHVEDILGPRAVWSLEHDAAGAGGAAEWSDGADE